MGAIRLFLALIVVIDHYRLIYLRERGLDVSANYVKFGMNAGYAVLFFYVISGFLMSYVLDRKYPDDARGAYQFYKSRFIRIFSLYWPAAIYSLLMFGFPRIPHKHRMVDGFCRIFLIGADWRVAFADYPRTSFKLFPTGLTPAWTLSAELTFYLIAPLVLRNLTATLCLFLMSAAVRAPLVFAFGHMESWDYHFFPATVLFFLLGNLVYRLSQALPSLANHGGSGWTLLTAAACFSLLGANRPFDGKYMYATVLCFALSVPAVFEKTKNNRLLNLLGDLSFPVYLIQLFVIWGTEPIQTFIIRSSAGSLFSTAYLLVGFVVLATVAVAFVAYFVVERPCAALMRLMFRQLEKSLAYVAQLLSRRGSPPKLIAPAGRFLLNIFEARPPHAR